MICPLGSTFFGLTPEYRQSFFSQIHEIVFNGQGGYTWSEVYNMPIWLRRFTFSKMKEHFKMLEERQKNATDSKKQTFGPNIKPNFTSTISKK